MATVFIDGTVYKNNKMGLVNTCLGAIGEAPLPENILLDPVLDIDGNVITPADIQHGTDAYVAKLKVEETTISVLSEGWWFNTDYNFKLYPNENNNIIMPDNVLTIRIKDNYIFKSGQLYDVSNHTYTITQPVTCDIIWLVDYKDLPPKAYNYIGALAARKFQTSVIGSKDLFQYTKIEEEEYREALVREHLRVMGYNLNVTNITNRTSNPV